MFEKYKILERNGLYYPMRRINLFRYHNVEYYSYRDIYSIWYTKKYYVGVDNMIEAVKILIGYTKPKGKFNKVASFRSLKALEEYLEKVE